MAVCSPWCNYEHGACSVVGAPSETFTPRTLSPWSLDSCSSRESTEAPSYRGQRQMHLTCDAENVDAEQPVVGVAASAGSPPGLYVDAQEILLQQHSGLKMFSAARPDHEHLVFPVARRPPRVDHLSVTPNGYLSVVLPPSVLPSRVISHAVSKPGLLRRSSDRLWQHLAAAPSAQPSSAQTPNALAMSLQPPPDRARVKHDPPRKPVLSPALSRTSSSSSFTTLRSPPATLCTADFNISSLTSKSVSFASLTLSSFSGFMLPSSRPVTATPVPASPDSLGHVASSDPFCPHPLSASPVSHSYSAASDALPAEPPARRFHRHRSPHAPRRPDAAHTMQHQLPIATSPQTTPLQTAPPPPRADAVRRSVSSAGRLGALASPPRSCSPSALGRGEGGSLPPARFPRRRPSSPRSRSGGALLRAEMVPAAHVRMRGAAGAWEGDLRGRSGLLWLRSEEKKKKEEVEEEEEEEEEGENVVLEDEEEEAVVASLSSSGWFAGCRAMAGRSASSVRRKRTAGFARGRTSVADVVSGSEGASVSDVRVVGRRGLRWRSGESGMLMQTARTRSSQVERSAEDARGSDCDAPVSRRRGFACDEVDLHSVFSSQDEEEEVEEEHDSVLRAVLQRRRAAGVAAAEFAARLGTDVQGDGMNVHVEQIDPQCMCDRSCTECQEYSHEVLWQRRKERKAFKNGRRRWRGLAHRRMRGLTLWQRAAAFY